MSVVVIRDRAKPLVLWRRLEPIPVEWNISNRGSLGRVARRSDGGWVVAGYEASRWFSIGGLPTRVQPSCSSRHSFLWPQTLPRCRPSHASLAYSTRPVMHAPSVAALYANS